MNDMMKKLLAKKKDKGLLSDEERDAKMSVLKGLRKESELPLAEKLKGMKKVSVMSDSEEGLEEGLEKAKEIVEGSEIEESEEDPYVDCSEEELDVLLQKLMAKKEKLKESKEEI